jgi:undecaprenyl-diphosphatase
MNFLQAVFLGAIQGLTEFIPVSSTAHLLIGQQVMGLPASEATFSFLVIVQWGTLVSLFVFYWQDLTSIALAMLRFRTPSPERDLGFYILLATLPALLIGYLLKDVVEILFRQPLLEAAIRLLTAAVLLAAAEKFGSRQKSLTAMTWWDALIVGLFQVVAVFPGASRSGTTISGGMLRGLDRASAARFAFLMSVPVLFAAGAYELLDVAQMPGLGSFLPGLAAGFISAAVVGWISIRWLVHYLSHNSLYHFALYCAVMGGVCGAAYWVGG